MSNVSFEIHLFGAAIQGFALALLISKLLVVSNFYFILLIFIVGTLLTMVKS